MDPTALFLMVAPGRGGVPPGPCWLCFFLFFGVGDSLRSNRALFVRVLRVCVCLCLWVLVLVFGVLMLVLLLVLVLFFLNLR